MKTINIQSALDKLLVGKTLAPNQNAVPKHLWNTKITSVRPANGLDEPNGYWTFNTDYKSTLVNHNWFTTDTSPQYNNLMRYFNNP